MERIQSRVRSEAEAEPWCSQESCAQLNNSISVAEVPPCAHKGSPREERLLGTERRVLRST